MRFLLAVIGGYFWATILTGLGLAAFICLYEQSAKPPVLGLRAQRILFLQLHFHEFFWTWAVIGMVLSFVYAITMRPLVTVVVKVDNRVPPAYEETYTSGR
jgi:hypothetical protein